MPKATLLACSLLFACLACAQPGDADPRGFADHPPRGWSSWSYFWNHPLSEAAIDAEADVMARSLKGAGYEYVNIDAGWQHGFDMYGRPQCDLTKFPHGIKAVADYVHGRGLKFGIYMQPGLIKDVWDANAPILGTAYTVRQISDGTTAGNTEGNAWSIDFNRPGASEYVQSIVNELASWGVDYIKLDFVGPGGGNVPSDNREELRYWAAAIKKSGRHIWLELSNSLSYQDVGVWQTYSNGWRIGGDIENYGGVTLTSWGNILDRFQNAARWAPYAGAGHWNDLDSLELGNGDKDGLTLEERKSAMTLWCISCSPLLLGSDLRTLDPADLKMLTNPEVLSIQAAGQVATPISQDTPQQVWRARNKDGSETVALFNLGDGDATMTMTWQELGIRGPASARDLWDRRDLGRFDTQFVGVVPEHGVILLRVAATAPR